MIRFINFAFKNSQRIQVEIILKRGIFVLEIGARTVPIDPSRQVFAEYLWY